MKPVHVPVKHAEEQINSTKHQQVLVEQPVDAPLPPEQQLGEATERDVSHLECVRHCHVHCCNIRGLLKNKKIYVFKMYFPLGMMYIKHNSACRTGEGRCLTWS